MEIREETEKKMDTGTYSLWRLRAHLVLDGGVSTLFYLYFRIERGQ